MSDEKSDTGPMPTGRRWNGMPVPFFFQAETADLFRELEVRDDDVVMSSLGKGGTTWTHKILYSLLHGIGDDGSPTAGASGLGSSGQVYPESLVPHRGAPADPANPEHMQPIREKFFGTWGFADELCAQTSPRLFSTHLYGQHLPAKLVAPDGKGKLVIVLRNLKDTLTSLHFFQGEAKDGWLGNSKGPGSLARFIHKDSPNAYGSPFEFVKQNDEIVQELQDTGRVLVVYFEDLSHSLPAQVDRLADFLEVPLSAAKRAAIIEACSFGAMKKQSGSVAAVTLRKGVVGDWKNHMSRTEWERFDQAFDEALDGVALAEPLRYHQTWEVDGMPPPRLSVALDNDPRTWPKFDRKTIVDGHVVRDGLITFRNKNAQGFLRPPSEFMGEVMPPGTPGAKHVAETGRYHLFVSGVCPWASSCRAARHLLGLEDVVSMDVADGQSGAGWVLLHGTSCSPWEATAASATPFYLHEVYRLSDPLCTTRITMPVLWDKKLNVIVSNDSWAIVKMFAKAFRSLGTAPESVGLGLVPPGREEELDAVHQQWYSSLLNGVYRAGVPLVMGKPEVHAKVSQEVYAAMDKLEKLLATQRFVMKGDRPTAVDLRVASTLIRFDVAYMHCMDLRKRGGILVPDATDPSTIGADSSYPHIAGYTRDMYQRLKPCVDWASFLQYYRWTKGLGQSEKLPAVSHVVASAEKPHGRDGDSEKSREKRAPVLLQLAVGGVALALGAAILLTVMRRR